MTRNDEVWKSEEVAKTFLESVRGAIPFAAAQIDVMLKIIQNASLQVDFFLDLGCGDGILGKAILTKYPNAKGIFLDFSEPMIQAAKSKLDKNQQVEFINQDFGKKEWVDSLRGRPPFDVIVSGFAIHHQQDLRKKEIYNEIYGLLKPGGIFLNMEQVASNSQWVEKIYEDLFIDSLYSFHQNNGSYSTRDEIAQLYCNRLDKAADILASVETQCEWLRELGFIHVDCFIKIFERALFGGIRPLEK